MFKKFFKWIKDWINMYMNCAFMCNHHHIMSILNLEETMKEDFKNLSSKEITLYKFHYNVFVKYNTEILLTLCAILTITLFIILFVA